MNLDRLELELRKLPGVRAAGFSERDDVLYVQVHARGADADQDSALAFQASRIAARHSQRPVAVELVRWQTPPEPKPLTTTNGGSGRTELFDIEKDTPDRADIDLAEGVDAREARLVLLAVLVFADADELEVHLTLGDRRSIGRAPVSRGTIAAVEATIDAVHGFSPVLPYRAAWARALESMPGHALVAVAVLAHETNAYRYGLAAGDNEVDAAARATLHALNRVLALELQRIAG